MDFFTNDSADTDDSPYTGKQHFSRRVITRSRRRAFFRNQKVLLLSVFVIHLIRAIFDSVPYIYGNTQMNAQCKINVFHFSYL